MTAELSLEIPGFEADRPDRRVGIGILATMSAANRAVRPPVRFLSLTFEWLGLIAVALLAGQFLAALLSLVLSAEALSRLVWLPTPVAVFFLLSLRVRGSAGRFAWPGSSGLWWSLVAVVPGAWLGALAGARLIPSLVGCGDDCTAAANRGFLAGASLVGLTTLITVFSWRAAVAGAFDDATSE